MSAPWPEYFGRTAICERLGISTSTLRTWIKTRQFPAYRRFSRTSKRHVWYSHEALIHAWEQQQIAQDRTTAFRHKPRGQANA